MQPAAGQRRPRECVCEHGVLCDRLCVGYMHVGYMHVSHFVYDKDLKGSLEDPDSLPLRV